MKLETQEENLQLLKNYVTYLKLPKTVDRNLLLLDSYEKRLGITKDTQEEDGPKKRSKPDDLVRVYESLIQNLTEIAELRADDPEQSKEIAAKILSYKAQRCFYMALSYSSASKWPEALALFDRAASQMSSAKDHYSTCKNTSEDTTKKIQEYENRIQGFKAEAHAKGFLELLKLQTREITTTTEKEKEETKRLMPTRYLLNSLNEFEFDFEKNKHLVPFPPDFEAIKCKPLLFDLALGECSFPSLEARKKTKGGTAGFWSLFGYGNK